MIHVSSQICCFILLDFVWVNFDFIILQSSLAFFDQLLKLAIKIQTRAFHFSHLPRFANTSDEVAHLEPSNLNSFPPRMCVVGKLHGASRLLVEVPQTNRRPHACHVSSSEHGHNERSAPRRGGRNRPVLHPVVWINPRENPRKRARRSAYAEQRSWVALKGKEHLTASQLIRCTTVGL